MNCLTLKDYLHIWQPSLLCLSFLCLPLFSYTQNCSRTVFRTIDGSCNNLNYSESDEWGKAQIPFYREIPAQYSSDDPFNSLIFPNRPNPRLVSNQLMAQGNASGNDANLSSFVFTWAQFLDHDITFSKGNSNEAANISLPPNEPLFSNEISFTRSAVVTGTGIISPREHENELTAWIDASNVYGSDEQRANWLRTFTQGKLKTSAGNLLPYNTIDGQKDGIIDTTAPTMDGIPNGQIVQFVAGDVRANEQPGLTTLHVLFVREHNRICDELISQGFQDDEEIYQRAKKQIGALIQVITYEEFLPALGIQITGYQGYDPNVKPDIMNIFATAAYRIGHTMVTSDLMLLNDDCSPVRENLQLEEAFFNNTWIEQLDIDPIMKGLAAQEQEAIDNKVIDGLRNFLFSIPQLPTTIGMDLVSINIQRGRDHGLPDFNTARNHFLGWQATSFAEINSDPIIAQELATLYNNDINNIDLWVGLLAEEHIPFGRMGRTMHNILKMQFDRLRQGDFYYYENDPFYNFFDKQNLKNTRLSAIIKRNTQLTDLAQNVFYTAPCEPLVNVDCDLIQVNPLMEQIEITGLDAPFVIAKVFDKNNGWQMIETCYGQECGQTQIFDVPAGDYAVQVEFYERAWTNLLCKKDLEVTVNGVVQPDCDLIDISATDAAIQVSGLTAPFNTVKIFDKNNGWNVIGSCNGTDCSTDMEFNLPAGKYHVQTAMYTDFWSNLICNKNVDITINGSSEPSCETVTVAADNGAIQINNLIAPFSTVKVFDTDNNWAVINSCIGSACGENPILSVPNGNYAVEITLYEGIWSNEICRKFFPINLGQSASNREGAILQANIYPNPVQEVINIDLKKYAGQKGNLILYNQFGQEMKSLAYDQLPIDLLKLEVENVQNGWYYLTIQVADHLPMTEKIMVSRLY